MGIYLNGNNISEFNNVYYNGTAQKQVFYNNTLVWKKQLWILDTGTFHALGTPTSGYAEGSTFATNQIISGKWLINCDGRADFWFPQTTSGYSTLNIWVTGREGAGHCYFFASPDKNRWGHQSPHFAECSTPGSYTLGISTGAMYIGVEALMGGIYINQMWLS